MVIFLANTAISYYFNGVAIYSVRVLIFIFTARLEWFNPSDINVEF